VSEPTPARVAGRSEHAERGGTLLVVEQLRRRVPGGIGRYATGLLQGLGEGDAEGVTLFASRVPGHAPGRIMPIADPLARWGFPVRTSYLPGRVLTRAWEHSLAAVPSGFAVVHSVSLALPALARPAPPLGVTVHDLSWREYPDATTARGRRWHERSLRKALERVEAFVVPSSPVRDALVDAGAPESSVSVVPLGGDHLPAPDVRRAEELLERSGVRGPYLLSVSTLEPRKNLTRLIAAYGEVRARFPEPWPLVVVGPRGWGSVHVGAAPPAGVLPVGPVADPVLAGLYQGARAFAYVPLVEGFGLPPLEAMGFGLPVVASDAVPSATGDPDSPCACLVDPLDTAAIADGILRTATDEALRATLSANGRARASARTWRQVAAEHINLWRSMA
jgi:glycosyltransferase involved in cell wall biosynthesis